MNNLNTQIENAIADGIVTILEAQGSITYMKALQVTGQHTRGLSSTQYQYIVGQVVEYFDFPSRAATETPGN